MTERLYYDDAYLTAFAATVTECSPLQDTFAVVLDRTAFYPTSGGQPHDTGHLNEVRVGDVHERVDGAIVHVSRHGLAVGDHVRGAVDWRRRFDHMQQHTGQHLLSAAFARTADVATVSFHLGEASTTIDLAREVSWVEVTAAEDAVAEVLAENREVVVRIVPAAEVAALPLRKQTSRSGDLRVVEVPAFDLSACGGTHVTRTGAVGLVAVLGLERVRGGSRVEFVCGARALGYLRRSRKVLSDLTGRLSVDASGVGSAVEKLQGELRVAHKTVRLQEQQLASYEARALIAQAQAEGSVTTICSVIAEADAARLKALATAIILKAPTVAVALFSDRTPASAVLAAGSESAVDAAAVLRALIARVGGRGGGRRDLAQGTLLAAGEELVKVTNEELRTKN